MRNENCNKRNKIGILGGTFNPIHNGHIILALEAYRQFCLDRILVMISPNPPHKSGEAILDIGKRAEMVRLAVSEYPDELQYSDFELQRKGYIYTADTLVMLRQKYPMNDYYFIMGGDSLRDIEKWYRPDIVLQNAVILAAVRDEMDTVSIERRISQLHSVYNADIRLLHTEKMAVSSTAIRENIYNRLPVSGMVPVCVEKYILENKCYLS